MQRRKSCEVLRALNGTVMSDSSPQGSGILQKVVDSIENSVFQTHSGSCRYELTMIVRAYTKPVQTSARPNTSKKSERRTGNTS